MSENVRTCFFWATLYITTILKRFNMEESKSTPSPVSLTKASGDSKALDSNVPYREAIGSRVLFGIRLTEIRLDTKLYPLYRV